MKYVLKLILAIILFLIHILNINAQKTQISGFVKDIVSGESLINAHVLNNITKKGVITNAYGFFSIPITGNDINLMVSYVGYKNKLLKFQSLSDTLITIGLVNDNRLKEVDVIANTKDIHSMDRPAGNFFMTGKELEIIPGLMGEKDILKSLQMMPGLQRGRDGTSGIFVRGGDLGQNLILLDGVPVYNVNHLFGIFSVFTPEAVKSVDVYKGGFPARYGGRLSSVLDIRLKEGNLYEPKFDFTIGTVAVKALVEGPIKKGKSSFIISGRRTYADIFFTPVNSFFRREESDKTEKIWSGYYFYDLNAKANFQLSNNDRIYFSAYMGQDKFYVNQKENKETIITLQEGSYSETIQQTTNFRNQWGNLTAALRWNKIINMKFFSNTTLTYSNYSYKFGTEYSSSEESIYNRYSENVDYQNFSGIENMGLGVDFDYFHSNNISFKFGIKSLINFYLPTKHENSFNSSSGFKHYEILFDKKIITSENTVYIENKLKLNDNVLFNLGINGMYYKSEDLNNFLIQPRILANVTLTDWFTLKTAFSRMAQPTHLLVNNSASYPVDIWVPAVKAFEPSVSNQFEIGFYNTFRKSLELSSEVFWKRMSGVLNYRNGESFFHLNDSWENKVVSGKGESYGLETMIEKINGKSTGWLGYNLSYAFRQFDELNNGNPFPFRYDVRQRLNIVFVHKLKPGINISASWEFATGAPITLSTTVYDGEKDVLGEEGILEDYFGIYQPIQNPDKAIYYSGINNFRLPVYHRLDVGITFTKDKCCGKREWNISVYNAYNRNNPFYLFYQINESTSHSTGAGEYKNFSPFGILPSVSYRLIID